MLRALLYRIGGRTDGQSGRPVLAADVRPLLLRRRKEPSVTAAECDLQRAQKERDEGAGSDGNREVALLLRQRGDGGDGTGAGCGRQRRDRDAA